MKFTHVLKFNAVPEWKEYYINYPVLKKLIIQANSAESHELYEGVPPVDEEAAGTRSPLLHTSSSLSRQGSLSGSSRQLNADFIKGLDTELSKVLTFYLRKEAELVGQLEAASFRMHSLEGLPSPPPESADLVTPQRVTFWSAGASKNVLAEREALKQRLTDLYKALDDLKKFVEINRTGFRKIIKKHDKMVSISCASYMSIVNTKLPEAAQVRLEELQALCADQYAVLACKGNRERARLDLSRVLRDQVEFQRNTVWKDMIGLERRGATVTVQEGAEAPPIQHWVKRHHTALALGVSTAAFVLLLTLPLFEEGAKQNCLALLAFVSLLWCTEAVPLFTTSMLVPLLVVVLQVMTDATSDPPRRLTPQEAAPAVFHSMFSQVIMLLLGGFAIASALSKHFIAKQLAVAILSRVGRQPRYVLLANMLVATFASMWISNVAAPVLCFSLVQPILRTLPPTHPLAKSLVIGIALASNLGGMTSPISSPQNIFAIERMSMDGDPPGWLSWFAVAIPVAVVGNLLCWGLILLVYQPGSKIREVRPLKPSEDPLTGTQIYVILVSLATVVLWCCNSFIKDYTGEMGVLAIVPLFAFFGAGVLTKDDFNGFLWNVVMLAMGGLALGEAVKSSGLLATIAEAIATVVNGQSLWMVLLIFCTLVLFCTTFISHTVGAMVILPIIQTVGEQLPGEPHPKLLVMGAALMCSGAMGLPVSGFPNMNAVALEDPTGVNYVDTIDFLKVGVPGSILTWGVIVTLGYWLMLVVKY